jgi:hypothetical protein
LPPSTCFLSPQEKKTALSRLSNLQDSARDLSKAAGGVGGGSSRPGSASSAVGGVQALSGPASREVRQLENRLDKAALKANEGQSIQRTYEQVQGGSIGEGGGASGGLWGMEEQVRGEHVKV